MDHWIDAGATANSFKQSFGTKDIRVERLDRRGKACGGITLGCQVKDVVRAGGLDSVDERDVVAQVPINKMQPVFSICAVKEMFDVIHWAAPAAHAVDFPIRAFKEKVGQV